jgi:hypothetical protein
MRQRLNSFAARRVALFSLNSPLQPEDLDPKADHQRIRNRVRGIGRRCRRCVLIPQACLRFKPLQSSRGIEEKAAKGIGRSRIEQRGRRALVIHTARLNVAKIVTHLNA